MNPRSNRTSALVPAVLAIGLWIAGLYVGHGMPSKIPTHPTDAQLLAWVRGNKNDIIAGSWLFSVGSLVFLWFAALVRERLAAVEGERHTLSTFAFGGAVAAAVCGLAMNADITTAINASDVSAATAGAFHHLSDLFFMGAELAMIPLIAGTTIVSLKTGIVPRWWALFGALVAVVLVIGPIGWAGLIFGTPVWMLGTSLLLFSERRARRAAVPAAASA